MKLFKHLTFYVFISIVLGILLGHFYPSTGVKMEIIGKRSSILLNYLLHRLFFDHCTRYRVYGRFKKVGKIGLKSLIYFEIVTTLALAIGVGVAYWLQPGNIDKSMLSMGMLQNILLRLLFRLVGFILSSQMLPSKF